LLLACLPAHAVDFVPMGGFRFGGSLTDTGDPSTSHTLNIDSSGSYGGIIDVPLPIMYGQRALELYYSRQRANLNGAELLSPPVADLTVTVMHVGLADTMATDDPRLTWLLIGSAGATRFAANSGSDTRPSLGMGAAVRWMANDHFGLRGDLRLLVNFTGGSGSAVCNGGCTLFYSSTVVVQGEATAGIVFRF
jgi:hypothetical protein